MPTSSTQPAWLNGFNLKNYDAARTFSAAQWIDQILFRLNLMDRLAVKNSTCQKGINDQELSELDALMQGLLAAPIAEHGYSIHSPGSRSNSTLRVYPLPATHRRGIEPPQLT